MSPGDARLYEDIQTYIHGHTKRPDITAQQRVFVKEAHKFANYVVWRARGLPDLLAPTSVDWSIPSTSMQAIHAHPVSDIVDAYMLARHGYFQHLYNGATENVRSPEDPEDSEDPEDLVKDPTEDPTEDIFSDSNVDARSGNIAPHLIIIDTDRAGSICHHANISYRRVFRGFCGSKYPVYRGIAIQVKDQLAFIDAYDALAQRKAKAAQQVATRTEQHTLLLKKVQADLHETIPARQANVDAETTRVNTNRFLHLGKDLPAAIEQYVHGDTGLQCFKALMSMTLTQIRAAHPHTPSGKKKADIALQIALTRPFEIDEVLLNTCLVATTRLHKINHVNATLGTTYTYDQIRTFPSASSPSSYVRQHIYQHLWGNQVFKPCLVRDRFARAASVTSPPKKRANEAMVERFVNGKQYYYRCDPFQSIPVDVLVHMLSFLRYDVATVVEASRQLGLAACFTEPGQEQDQGRGRIYDQKTQG